MYNKSLIFIIDINNKNLILYAFYYIFKKNYNLFSYSSLCIALQDPHCAWDVKQGLCIAIDSAISRRTLVQDVINGDGKKCWYPPKGKHAK